MSQLPEFKSDSPMLEQMQFRPYRQAVERQAFQFSPTSDEEQTLAIVTPWGETLLAKNGDYIVNELDTPKDRWPVERTIFENSYMAVRPGYYVKSALTHLASFDAIINHGDQRIIVHTLEGIVTIWAKDFYLARGIQGEIWPYPKDKADKSLILAE